jgi:hypothetical protein
VPSHTFRFATYLTIGPRVLNDTFKMSGENNIKIFPESKVQKVAEEWDEKHARGRGIFTEKDRKYLWRIKQYDDSPSSLSKRRKAIEKRTTDGIRDLYYLPMIEDYKQDHIVENLENPHPEIGTFRDAIAGLIHFAYRNMDYDERWLEQTIQAGIIEALGFSDRVGGDATVEIDVNDGYDLDKLESMLDENPEALTPAEIGYLAKDGRLDPEEIEDLESVWLHV